MFAAAGVRRFFIWPKAPGPTRLWHATGSKKAGIAIGLAGPGYPTLCADEGTIRRYILRRISKSGRGRSPDKCCASSQLGGEMLWPGIVRSWVTKAVFQHGLRWQTAVASPALHFRGHRLIDGRGNRPKATHARVPQQALIDKTDRAREQVVVRSRFRNPHLCWSITIATANAPVSRKPYQEGSLRMENEWWGAIA